MEGDAAIASAGDGEASAAGFDGAAGDDCAAPPSVELKLFPGREGRQAQEELWPPSRWGATLTSTGAGYLLVGGWTDNPGWSSVLTWSLHMRESGPYWTSSVDQVAVEFLYGRAVSDIRPFPCAHTRARIPVRAYPTHKSPLSSPTVKFATATTLAHLPSSSTLCHVGGLSSRTESTLSYYDSREGKFQVRSDAGPSVAGHAAGRSNQKQSCGFLCADPSTGPPVSTWLCLSLCSQPFIPRLLARGTPSALWWRRAQQPSRLCCYRRNRALPRNLRVGRACGSMGHHDQPFGGGWGRTCWKV